MLSAAASSVFSIVASVAAFAMLLNSLTNFVPVEFKRFIILMIRGLVNRYMWGQKLTLIIPEFDGLVKNKVYEAATVYLGGKINTTTRSLRLCKHKREKSFKITMEYDEEVYDVFDGSLFGWRMVSERLEGDIKQEGQKIFMQQYTHHCTRQRVSLVSITRRQACNASTAWSRTANVASLSATHMASTNSGT